MNGSFRAARVLAGAAQHGAAPLGVLLDERHLFRAAPLQAAARHETHAEIRFAQPARLNWARYESVKNALHPKVCVISALITSCALAFLWWKAAHGEPVSLLRWLFGAASGWFVARMFRLGLFCWLSAPRELIFCRDGLLLSGLGTLKPDRITCWSVVREFSMDARIRPCVRVELICRWPWCGRKRRWIMLMNGGAQAERLESLLEQHLTAAGRVRQPEQSLGLRLKHHDESIASPHAPRVVQAKKLPPQKWHAGDGTLRSA